MRLRLKNEKIRCTLRSVEISKKTRVIFNVISSQFQTFFLACDKNKQSSTQLFASSVHYISATEMNGLLGERFKEFSLRRTHFVCVRTVRISELVVGAKLVSEKGWNIPHGKV